MESSSLSEGRSLRQAILGSQNDTFCTHNGEVSANQVKCSNPCSFVFNSRQNEMHACERAYPQHCSALLLQKKSMPQRAVELAIVLHLQVCTSTHVYSGSSGPTNLRNLISCSALGWQELSRSSGDARLPCRDSIGQGNTEINGETVRQPLDIFWAQWVVPFLSLCSSHKTSEPTWEWISNGSSLPQNGMKIELVQLHLTLNTTQVISRRVHVVHQIPGGWDRRRNITWQ